MLLDGKKVRDELLEDYKKIVKKNKLDITLAIIFVGDDAPSAVYVNNKVKYCGKVGIKTRVIKMDGATLEKDVIKEIKKLNKDENVTGIILQSPVPKHINLDNCVSYIDPKKDIDGFTKDSFYALGHHTKGLRPCTAKGIVKLLKYYDIPLASADICIIGRGNLVGKPLAFELLKENATVTLCHSKTKDLKKKTKKADIIILGAGCPRLLKRNMIKTGVVVVDAGITVCDGKIIGDADFINIKDKCSYITPNPGGVGPMTIAMIIENLIEAKMEV